MFNKSLKGTRRLSLSTVRGSFTLEYAVLIAIVISAVLGMSVYSMRALSGRWRTVGDTFGFGRQYDPKTTVITGN